MQQPDSLPAAEVIEILKRKVARNPGDLDSAIMLGSALYQVGDHSGSAAALQTALQHQPDNSQVLMLLARTEARQGKLARALKLFERVQTLNPADSKSWQVAAALAAEIRDWSELLRIASGWTRHQPQSKDAWQALSRAHFEESRFEQALAAMDRLMELEPNVPSHLVSAGRIAIAALDYDLARRYLNAAQALGPDSSELLFAFCRLHHLTGELVLAEEFCRKTIAARPDYAPAYIELGILREGRLEDAEIEVVNRMFQEQSVHPENRAMLGLALGDALDRKGDADGAFDAWDKANAINRDISAREGYVYQPDEFARELDIQAELFRELPTVTVGPLADKAGDGNSRTYPTPIFVVGMPRSGTTLLESILASHSRVVGGGELPTLYDIYEELLAVARNEGIESARNLLGAAADAWRERYLSALPETSGADFVVDKQPLNFRGIGLIRLLFPSSPVVYIQRQPADVGLSIYRHKFTKSWPCASSLNDIGHYYGIHCRMVEFWQERFPGFILAVDYAALVDQPESQIQELLTRIGLAPEPACLAPHKTRRAVATFSAIQVQNPMSAKFSNRSAPYAARLAPFRQGMAQAGIDLTELGDVDSRQ